MPQLSFALGADGALSIASATSAEGGIALAAGYPAIDGRPLRPLGLMVQRAPDRETARWRLPGGAEVTLEAIHATPPDDDAPVHGDAPAHRLRLRLTLAGFATAPATVAIQGLMPRGATRAWCMAQGLGGNARLINLPATTQETGHICTAAIAADGASVGLWCEDLSRFAVKTTWSPEGLAIAFATEGIPLPDGRLELPAIMVESAATTWPLLTTMTSGIAVAAGAVPKPPRLTWCSWYYFYHHFTRADLDRVLAGLSSLPDRGGVTTVQIDAGYCTSIGDWLEPNHLWPGGLEAAFKAIRAAGFVPGIWIGPFMVGSRSTLAHNHPDWLLRDAHGVLLAPIKNYGEHRLWHYPDEEYHVLDTSHPDAMAYLREVFTTLIGWGADYVKTDFLFWGLHDAAAVRRAVPGRTSIEEARATMQMVRDVLGPERYLLGCIAPYAPCLGLVDGMRIAGDVGPAWGGAFSPQGMLKESLHALAVDGRWFHSDPDALLVRDFHSDFLPHEVEALCLWQALTGSNISTSDPLDRISADRLDLWRFCDITRAPAPAFAPGYGHVTGGPLVAARPLGGDRFALLVFNATDAPERFQRSIASLIGWERAFVHSWRPDPGPAIEATAIEADLAPHHARLWLLAASPQDILPATLSG